MHRSHINLHFVQNWRPLRQMLQIFAGIAEWRTANWQNRVIILASTQNTCRAELRPRLTVVGNISKCTQTRRTVTPALQRTNTENSKQMFPEKELRGQGPNFHTLGLWAIYIFPRSICIFCCKKYMDRSWEYINVSQTHECWNWDWGRAIPRKGIHKWDFRCSAKACESYYIPPETAHFKVFFAAAKPHVISGYKNAEYSIHPGLFTRTSSKTQPKFFENIYCSSTS
jgi:hypothetical protein